MSYTLAERARVQRLTCLRCDARPDIDWIDTTGLNDPEPRWTPGRVLCPTPGCVDEDGRRSVPLLRCRTCGRPTGDVHSAECGPVMRVKAVAPHLVSIEDCVGP